MCKFSNKLIAWLDEELSGPEAADIESHLPACGSCRTEVEKYREVSGAFQAFCNDVSPAPRPRRRVLVWALGTAAIAAAVLVGTFLGRPQHLPEPIRTARIVQMPAAMAATPVAQTAVHRHRRTSPAPVQNASWMAAEPAIQIVIPADEVFPPGMIPAGVDLTAELTIGADGFPQGLRLRQ